MAETVPLTRESLDGTLLFNLPWTKWGDRSKVFATLDHHDQDFCELALPDGQTIVQLRRRMENGRNVYSVYTTDLMGNFRPLPGKLIGVEKFAALYAEGEQALEQVLDILLNHSDTRMRESCGRQGSFIQ